MPLVAGIAFVEYHHTAAWKSKGFGLRLVAHFASSDRNEGRNQSIMV
jgi:hypothetical protein